jgi:hypothetical protein
MGGPIVSISYGVGRPPFDPTIVEGMLLVLTRNEPLAGMTESTATTFARTAEPLRAHMALDRIPYAETSSGFAYATFAGKTMNEVLARGCAVTSFDAGELVLRASEPMDFSSLATSVADYLPVATRALDAPDQLTLFQQMLPPALLQEELGQVWLKTPVYERTLQRLRTAELVQVPESIVASLGD